MTEAVSQPISTLGSTVWARLATEIGSRAGRARRRRPPHRGRRVPPARAGRCPRSTTPGALVPLGLVVGFAVVLSAPAGRRPCCARARVRDIRHRVRDRGRLLHAERRPVGRRLHRVAVARRRHRARRSRLVTLWRTRRTDDSRRRRYLRRALLVLAALVVATQVMFPLVIAQVMTHTARAHVPTPDLGAPHENVSFTTSDGLRLEGWFVPSQNGATVIVFPGRSGPQSRRGCSCATATAYCSSTDVGRAEATVIRTRSAGQASAICMRRPRTSSLAPTSTRSGSAPSAYRSEARC